MSQVALLNEAMGSIKVATTTALWAPDVTMVSLANAVSLEISKWIPAELTQEVHAAHPIVLTLPLTLIVAD